MLHHPVAKVTSDEAQEPQPLRLVSESLESKQNRVRLDLVALLCRSHRPHRVVVSLGLGLGLRTARLAS